MISVVPHLYKKELSFEIYTFKITAPNEYFFDQNVDFRRFLFSTHEIT